MEHPQRVIDLAKEESKLQDCICMEGINNFVWGNSRQGLYIRHEVNDGDYTLLKERCEENGVYCGEDWNMGTRSCVPGLKENTATRSVIGGITYTIQDLGENDAIHCKTQEEAKRICKLMHEAGKTWCNGCSYLKITYREYAAPTICYNMKGQGSCVEDYKEEGYNIIPSEQIVESKISLDKFKEDPINSEKHKTYTIQDLLGIPFPEDKPQRPRKRFSRVDHT